jgi:hypothetical protein
MPDAQQIEQRTQEILKLQLGDLVLTCAHLRATIEQLRAELAAATSTPGVVPHEPT